MFEKEIEAGVKYLSDVPGWYNKINLSDFDIKYTDKCILGQLDIKTIEYQYKYGLSVDNSITTVSYDENADEHIRQLNNLYNILTKEWTEKILSLREQDDYTKKSN